MPYTFGGATSHDITFAAGATMGGTGNATFVYGWWLPTTLTAGRGLWSAGNTTGAEIDTTTSELRLRTDNSTDGQWTTSGVGLAVDQWQFLAFLLTTDNTNGAYWAVWSGTLETLPVEATVSVAVARIGNFSGSSSFYIGNKGTGTVAFQGDIAHVGVHVVSTPADSTQHPWGLDILGSTPAAEVLPNFYETVVTSCWQGESVRATLNRNRLLTQVGPAWRHLTLEALPVPLGFSPAAPAPFAAPTINGATVSENGPPRPLRQISNLYPFVRR